MFGDHHESHAASAFYPSPFEEAAIITVDGVGEWATASLGTGRGSDLRLLKELEGYPKVIVSNGQRVFSELEMRYLGLYNQFSHVIFSSDLGHKKPDPRIFLEATKLMGWEPEEVLCIGDNFENDIVPSARLGMKAMHIEEAWRLFG